MNRRIARPAGLTLLTSLAVLIGVVGVVALTRADRSRQAEVSLLDLARAVELPSGAVPFAGVTDGCPTAQYVHCGRLAGADVEEVAGRMQATLSVLADEEAELSCEDWPPTRGPERLRSCTVRIERSGHAVLIMIDTMTRRVNGNLVRTGAQVRVTTS